METHPERDSDDAGDAGGRFVRLLVLSRPRFWLYLAGPVLVGLAHGAETVAALVSVPAAALVGYFLVPANVLLYGINDVFDADLDAHNPKKSDRETRYRGERTVLVAVALAGAAGVATIALTPATAWPWLAGFFVLAVAYSAPPLRLKTTPPLDSLSNGLYVLPGAAAYAALAGTHPPWLALAGGWLWTAGMHAFSAIPDVEPDRAAGIRTTATVLGARRTYRYVGALWSASALLFALLDPRAGALLAVYPAFLAGIARSDVAVDRAYWWFPAINAVVGTALTLAGLWRFVRGG